MGTDVLYKIMKLGSGVRLGRGPKPAPYQPYLMNPLAVCKKILVSNALLN
jgi:hypothetical protein